MSPLNASRVQTEKMQEFPMSQPNICCVGQECDDLPGREGTRSSVIIQEAGRRLSTSFPARHGFDCCDPAS